MSSQELEVRHPYIGDMERKEKKMETTMVGYGIRGISREWKRRVDQLGRRVIERRGVFYSSRFVAPPVFPTPANVSCTVQRLRKKIVGLRRTGKN